eukprot:197520_1
MNNHHNNIDNLYGVPNNYYDDNLYGDHAFEHKYSIYKKHHKKLKPKHKHLHIWLPTKKLLNEFDDTIDDKRISDECLHKIINKIYGNTSKFIEYLIQNRDEKK